MESKTPSRIDVSITMLLTSRARYLSDMLIYESPGHWQILVNYMSSSVEGRDLSEDENRNHGLFIYHAIYQQWKRMEKMSSKFPTSNRRKPIELGELLLERLMIHPFPWIRSSSLMYFSLTPNHLKRTDSL